MRRIRDLQSSWRWGIWRRPPPSRAETAVRSAIFAAVEFAVMLAIGLALGVDLNVLVWFGGIAWGLGGLVGGVMTWRRAVREAAGTDSPDASHQ